MSNISEITVSVSDEVLIQALKRRGFSVFEQVPKSWSDVSDDGLGMWSLKLRNWATDANHIARHQRDLISAEIEKRGI